MDHQTAAELFSDYVDEELGDPKKSELERHLAVCMQCRTELTSFRQTVGLLGKMKGSAPPSFLRSVQNQIHTRSKGRFFGKRWLLFGRIPFEWVSLAMIIALLVYYLAVSHSSPTHVNPAP